MEDECFGRSETMDWTFNRYLLSQTYRRARRNTTAIKPKIAAPIITLATVLSSCPYKKSMGMVPAPTAANAARPFFSYRFGFFICTSPQKIELNTLILNTVQPVRKEQKHHCVKFRDDHGLSLVLSMILFVCRVRWRTVTFISRIGHSRSICSSLPLFTRPTFHRSPKQYHRRLRL